MTRRSRLTLAVVLLPLLVYSVFRFSVGPLLPSIEENLSISVAVSGALVSASTVMVGIGTAAAGYSAAKLGEKRTVLFGLVLFSVPLAVCTAFRTFPLFASLFVASGLGAGLMTTPTYAIAATIYPRRKGAAAGTMSASYNLGGFVGPTLSGVLLNFLGWQFPFLAIGLLGLTFALVFRSGLSSYETPRRVEQASSSLARDLRHLVSNRNVLAVAAAQFLTDLGFYTYVTYTIQYLGDRFHLARAALVPIDVYFGLAVGIGALGVIVLGMFYDRVGGKLASALICAVIALTSLVLYAVPGLLAATLLLFLVGFFLNSPFGILSVLVQVNVPEFSRASAVSFVQTTAFAGAVLGLILAGALFGATVTPGPLIATVTVPYALSAALLAAAYSRSRETEVRPGEARPDHSG